MSRAATDTSSGQQWWPLDNINKDVWQKIMYYDVWNWQTCVSGGACAKKTLPDNIDHD